MISVAFVISAGKQGVVKRVFRKTNRVLVEGMNYVKKSVKGDEKRKSGVFLMEMPIHVSNVMLLDPIDKKVVRVGFKYLDDGTKVRVSKRSGAVIPKPDWRGVVPKERAPLHPEKDTPTDVVHKRTYQLPDDLLHKMELLKQQALHQIEANEAIRRAAQAKKAAAEAQQLQSVSS